jgi:hypothetical protein
MALSLRNMQGSPRSHAAKSAGLREQRLQARERSRALGGQTVPSDRPDLG